MARLTWALMFYIKEDGYHEINTIMQQIDLCDTLTIREKKKE